MNELWYIIGIGILSLISTIISSKGPLYDKHHKWYKRLTKGGKWAAAIGLTIIAFSFLQYRLIKKRDDRKDGLLKVERDNRDSIISARITSGVDSSTNKLFTDLSIAFANQNLRLDTVRKRIESLRDSAKTVIVNNARDLPRIIIREDGIKIRQINDTSFVNIAILSTQSEANLEFLDYICKLDYSDGSSSYTSRASLCKGPLLMPKEQLLNNEFYITSSKPIFGFSIAIIGLYKPVDENRPIELLDIYVTKVSTGKTGFLMGINKENALISFGIKKK
ncbi:MAG: hypothetical protein J0M30_14445 [Chitinophagales bacterium]|nr:hypothetical protein [Chitinophagales bacterium]